MAGAARQDGVLHYSSNDEYRPDVLCGSVKRSLAMVPLESERTIAKACGLDAATPCLTHHTRCNRARAFTLLELLVAMVLMVVVASCLYTALYTGFRARRSAMSAVEPTALAVNAIELLKQDIYGVLAPDGVLAGAFVGTNSAGIKGVDADSLEFYTTHIYAADDEVAAGLGQIELMLTEDGDTGDGTYQLVRRVTTNLLSLKAVDPDEQILCRNVVSLNLRYFDGDGWVDAWDSTADANSLPQAVEIDIEIAHDVDRRTDEPKKRRLVQCFAIPCGVWAKQESESEG